MSLRKLASLALLFLVGSALAQDAKAPPKPLSAQFQNPVLSGFHADPSVCRVGDDYFLVTSSFEYFPGVPIYHSKDLVHWRQLGHVLTRKSQLDVGKLRASMGIFAPTLRHHDGTFYMITTLVGGGGNFYVTATNAAGPWSDPVWIDRAGIDPSLFFDADGKVYYTRQVDGELGYSGQQLLNLATGKLEGQMKELWRGTGGVWPEGPHLYRVNGKYYLMISEGGTSYDHRLTVARSDSPWGPFEANPKNPILTHRHLPDHPFQALGHGDLIETPDGWWVTCLGFRPQGGRFHHLGRETFLAPVTWQDGWPVINDGQPITATMAAPKLTPHPWPAEPARDEFNTPSLRLCWQFVRNPVAQNYSLTERPGWLRLKGSAVSLNDVDSPTFVGRSQNDLHCRITTQLSFAPKQTNEEAGLVVRGNDRNHCDILVTQRAGRRQIGLRKVFDGQAAGPIGFQDAPGDKIVLGIKAAPTSYEFFWSGADGVEHSLGTARTRDLSSETLSAQKGAGFNFTGVFIGLFASGNGTTASVPADFDWFEYQPTAPRNLFAEAGHSDSEIKARLDSAFTQLFYGDPKHEAVYFKAGRNAQGEQAYILDIHNDDVRSEGMSYGMMIAVQMNKKAEFDALWNWAKTHMQQTATNHPAYGYFAWSVKTNGVPNDEMPAPDGEEYFATALLFAAGRWGNGDGIYNYQTEANELLTNLRHRAPISGTTSAGPMTAGAIFHPGHKMVRFSPDHANSEHTDPSYHVPAFYELWALHGPASDRAFWRQAATESRDFFPRAAHPVTGLTPDYSEFGGTPWAAPWNTRATNFVADAWRTAMNWSVDWAWWHADPRAQELSNRLLSFFTAQGVNTYASHFTLDGRPLNQDHSSGLVAMNAVAALAADPDLGAPFVEALWNCPTPQGRYRYYDGMLHLLALLHCSGEFRIWAPAEMEFAQYHGN